ncbi:MAG: phosphatidate cytidylyltransferase [Flaviaesturariibacter sp.]|nr:phosphatidate cytidylyltransferase [Flaviaesturariibacter sp.]
MVPDDFQIGLQPGLRFCCLRYYCCQSKGPAELLQYILKIDTMARFNYLWICFIALAMTLTSCEVVGGIFKAGFWTAIIIVVIVVSLILWLLGKRRR